MPTNSITGPAGGRAFFAQNPAEPLLSRLENVRERGPGSWVARCPAHQDKTPSLSIDQKADGRLLLKCFAGCSAADITAAVGLSVADLFPPRLDAARPGPKVSPIQRESWMPIAPIPDTAPPAPAAHHKHGKPSAIWTYRDSGGSALCHVCRFETPGGKTFAPLTFCRSEDGSKTAWRWQALPEPRPLYNLHLLAQNPAAPVVLCEGEKSAAAAAELMPDCIATTTPNGAQSPAKADWTPLNGRSVWIWLDNDEAGRKYADAAATLLQKGGAKEIRVINVAAFGDALSEPGSDAADLLANGWTAERLQAIRQAEGFFEIDAEPDSDEPPEMELPPLDAYEQDVGRSSDGRPAINIEGGKLPEMTDAAERALLADTEHPAIYQRDIQLVRAVRAASDNITGHIRRQAGSLRIVPVDPAYLLERLTQAAAWLKWNERAKKWKPADAPRSVVDTYIGRIGRWNCPALTGIIEAPTLRPDGSILESPGYDEKTGLIFDPGATRFEPIPDSPSMDDARRAIEILKGAIKDFPFVAEHDAAVVLAAILTALVRKSLRSAPLFGFSAPVMGSGKSLLADVVALIATGRRAPAWTYTGDPDEERKHITSALLAGDPVACIDNVSSPLDSDRLCSVLTQESIRDRLLGVMKEVTMSTACLWMATGNNLEIRGDLATRALVCRLDAVVENPEEREFKVDLIEWIPANRPALVAAALTILRAYHVAGRPKQPIKQFGRFETWSDFVRAALVWSGADDPCKARIQVAAADPARQQLFTLMNAWYAVFKDQSVTTAEVTKAARVVVKAGEETYDSLEYEALRDAILTIAGHGEAINARIFGRYLARNKGRPIDGHRLELAGTYGHTQKWRVCRGDFGVSGVSGVSSPPRADFRSEDCSQRKEAGTETAKSGEGIGGNSKNSSNSTNRPEPPPAADDFEVW